MKRQIITIDDVKCNGCGACITGCPEGALQMIDNKARLVSDLFCDGLGACIGTCPEGAITIEEREAEPYDERKVMENIVLQGENTIKAHLKHLADHGENLFLSQAIAFLEEKGVAVPDYGCKEGEVACGCSGGTPKAFNKTASSGNNETTGKIETELRQWPVQLHLINPNADYFNNADVLISADCVPYAFGDYHRRFLKGKIVITLCPKLDKDIDRYIDKLADIFSRHNIRSLSIVRMEVPCCGGTEMIVQKALEKAGKVHMVKLSVISLQGEIL
jgi:Pyruvate/2-oxoacid:ferredoxin oxidoreductase delta subunit